ncbi:MAG: Sapep family Mn(2+)-dependent dipeptidase [Clostridia bacterium]|nr:Sapep family Mn(2+)-dependent dipeptidase [Clostridia bacterium]
MNERVNQLLERWMPEYTAMLQRWVQVPSVKDSPAEGAPFGVEVRRMLDTAREDIEGFGFETRVFDGYAMDATLPGRTDEVIAVLGHLDVVPVGDGWRVPPFAGVLEGETLLGRGAIDDKGPALAALFALRAIREAGVPLKKGVRLILGCDEESGWQCMAYYMRHAEMPRVGFSPDASFPLINTEKGALHVLMHGRLAAEGLQVKELWTGERMNVIPGVSTALVEGGEAEAETVRAFAERTGLPVTAEVTPQGLRLTAEGIPGHAAYPEGCRNAIGLMLLTLRELGVQGCLRTLAGAVGLEYDGASLGIACRDEVSGPLTCNLGILHVDAEGGVFATLDCRCPITADLKALDETARAHLSGFTFEPSSFTPPHHVPADSELVTALLAAYTGVTGEEAEPESTGGGTYAKVLAEGVAFGAVFPGESDLCHQANELVSLPNMLRAAKIYADAIIRLCGE